MPSCPFCGAALAGSPKFCGECGKSLAVEEGAQSASDVIEACADPIVDGLSLVVAGLLGMGWELERRETDVAELVSTRSGRHVTLTLGPNGAIYQSGDIKLDLSAITNTPSNIHRAGEMALEAKFSRQAEEVISCAVRYFGGGGWTTSVQAPKNATFAYTIPPNGCLGVFLLFLLIIPGVLYFLLANKNVTTSLTANDNGAGSTLYCSWSDFNCRPVCEDFCRMVTEQEESGAALAVTRFPKSLSQ
jgi:hypothetical protein